MDITDYIGKHVKVDFYDHAIDLNDELNELIHCVTFGKLERTINDGAGVEIVFWDLITTDEELRKSNRGSSYIITSSITSISVLSG